MSEDTYCPQCTCPACEAARDKEAEDKWMDDLVKTWNWDRSPAEVAREIIDYHLDWKDQLLDKIEQYFSAKEREAVEDCLDAFA